MTTRAVRDIRALQDIELLERQPLETLIPSRNLHEVLQANAALHGDRPALTVLGSGQVGDVRASFTHRALLGEVTRAANLFTALGLGPGSVISILSRTHERVPALLWGAETTGVASCINYLLSAEVIAALLQAEQASTLVCPGPALDAELWAKAQAVMALVPGLTSVLVLGGRPAVDDPRVRCLDTLMDAQSPDGLMAQHRPGRHDLAALFHTGGTTGVPKVVPQTHLNQIHAAWSLAQLFGLSEQDVALNGFPLFHVGGTSTIGLSVLAAGGHVVMLSPNGLRDRGVVDNIWRLVEHHRATVLGGVPTSIGSMGEVPVDGADLSSLRFAFTGGASLPTAIAQRFEARSGVRLLEQYGMTETVAALATTPVLGRQVRGSVGIRCPFSTIDIVTHSPQQGWLPCASGQVGSVVVKGPQVFGGYLDPRHNVGAFTPDGGLITGDLGYLDAEGYLHLTGREKDLIIRSGHNIDPLVIEEVANAHPAVALSAAVGMPDGYAGELPVVFVAPAPGHTIDTAEVQDHIATRVPEPPARPRHVFVLETIPVTGVGKIYKPALRDLALTHKLRMEVAALDAPIDVLCVSPPSEAGPASLQLRLHRAADLDRCQRQLQEALGRLLVPVQVTWTTAPGEQPSGAPAPH